MSYFYDPDCKDALAHVIAERDRLREALKRLVRTGDGGYVALTVEDDEFVRQVQEALSRPEDERG